MPANKKLQTIISLLISCYFLVPCAEAQGTAALADSIRIAYDIPEIAYAVVSADSILELQALGEKKVNSGRKADINDLFRLGSNTKPITGFVAALLVKEGKIAWDTRFFDLFPELKKEGNPAYYELTLKNLLTFRSKLSHYTYTDKIPTVDQFTGNEAEQRYQFIKWVIAQKPVRGKDSINFSNPSYVLAGAMLEKATGKTYEQLVHDMGKKASITLHFGQPNNIDTLQLWGHNARLKPEPPGENRKLNWLLPAGNITTSLSEYIKFIQLQMSGLAGKSNLLSPEEFYFLRYGCNTFSVGWFNDIDENKTKYAWHVGNPGTFLSNVYVFDDQDRAYILFANVQSEAATDGLNVIYEHLKSIYNH
jgi:CubicO group peptidase (beta-lactamase class C family)